jgi:predicted HicB family RNase H-like nuclease
VSLKKTGEERSKPVTITMARWLHKAAKKAAAKEYLSLSELVSDLLKTHLDNEAAR